MSGEINIEFTNYSVSNNKVIYACCLQLYKQQKESLRNFRLECESNP